MGIDKFLRQQKDQPVEEIAMQEGIWGQFLGARGEDPIQPKGLSQRKTLEGYKQLKEQGECSIDEVGYPKVDNQELEWPRTRKRKDCEKINRERERERTRELRKRWPGMRRDTG